MFHGNTEKRECPLCGRRVSRTNMSKHYSACLKASRVAGITAQEEVMDNLTLQNVATWIRSRGVSLRITFRNSRWYITLLKSGVSCGGAKSDHVRKWGPEAPDALVTTLLKVIDEYNAKHGGPGMCGPTPSLKDGE